MIAIPALNENDQVTLCFLHPNEAGYKILPELDGAAVFTRKLTEGIIISLNAFGERERFTTSESDK